MKNLMRRLAVWLLGNRVDTPAAPVPPPVANPLRVPAIVAARARQPGPSAAAGNQPPPSPFKLPDFPKSSMPPDGNPTMAQDDAISESLSWAQNSLMQQYGSYLEGQTFLGYPKLAELAQRPEYRRISQTHARHMTRKWIKFNSAGGEDKQERIRELEKEIERLHLKDRFREVVEQDGFFGRSHLFLDFGATNPDELKMPIGDGTSDLSKSKIAKGSLKAVRCIEAVWCYPQSYNSIDPLRPDWYRPEHWYVQTRQVHRSRLLTFVGREVPDMLKPAYGFGGLPLTQMAKPYVDNWLRTRQSVADLVEAFSVMVLGTNIIDQMNAQDGDPLFARVDLFNNLRNNRGTMVIDKNSETLTNVSAPLGTLDALQAQSQEHMASVSGIPLIFLLGITPTGLNATSEFEMRSFYDDEHAAQESMLRPNLQTVLAFVQLSLWGAVDPDLTFEFVDLWSLDDEKRASVRKTEAETDDIYVAMGAVDPKEVRVRLAGDPEEPYGIDPANPEEGMPEPPPAPPMPGDPNADPNAAPPDPANVARGTSETPPPIARAA